jgi:O-methyltransferase
MRIYKFLFNKLSILLSKKNIYLVKSLNYKKQPLPLPANFDYVRYAALGLCYEEIIRNKITGSIAELGVYQGDFAARLNSLFPERPLYLFDTFQGFSQKDIEVEKSKSFSSGDQDFSDTSVEVVLSKMKNSKSCIIRKGVFPGTASDVEDTFCFVSIDADLFAPILSGLEFFYPKLQKGGFIFIHDFNNDQYTGARQAVLEYCREKSIGYVPLPDICGTVVITK